MTDAVLLSRQQLAREAYLWACELELKAFKPGNVSLYADGHDMTVEDFRISARVSAPALCNPSLTLGEKIFRAIEATRSAVGCNTNLGIVLLAAPLIQAWLHPADSGISFHESVKQVLHNTTVEDADRVYRAIRLAQPAGLGHSASQDVQQSPKVTLLDAMRIAAGWDSIARQYTDSFVDVFNMAVPLYHSRLSMWGDETWAAAAVFLRLLTVFPDSHIERKFGSDCSRQISGRVARMDANLSETLTPQEWLGGMWELDQEFKSRGINPGTTADLTVATLLIASLDRADPVQVCI